ncbi:MAG: hypothetical protein KKC85_12045, partial [Gammaproteobacteria bacterium]|nr:hypothetical protein [Gammaproteobacteria bacterium]
MRIQVPLDPGEFIAFYLANQGDPIQAFDGLEVVVSSLAESVVLCIEDWSPPVPRVLLACFPLDFQATLGDLCKAAKLAPWLPPKRAQKNVATLLRAQLIGSDDSKLEARLVDELAQWGVEMMPGRRGLAARFSYSKLGAWQLKITQDARSRSQLMEDQEESTGDLPSKSKEASPQDVDMTARDLLPIVCAFNADGACKSLKRASGEQAQFVAPGASKSKRKSVSGWPTPVVQLEREKFAILVLRPSSDKPGSVGLGVLPADRRVNDAYLLTIHDRLSDVALFTYLPRSEKVAQIVRRIAIARAADFVRWLTICLKREGLHMVWRKQGPVLTVSLDTVRDDSDEHQSGHERILEAVKEVLNANLGPCKIDSEPKGLTSGLIHVKVQDHKQHVLSKWTLDESIMLRLQPAEALDRGLRVLTTLSMSNFMACPDRLLTRVDLSSLPYFVPAVPRLLSIWSYDRKTHQLAIFHADEAALGEGAGLLQLLNFILHNQAEGTVHIEFMNDLTKVVAMNLKRAFEKQIRGLEVIVARWAPAKAAMRRFSLPADS